MKNINRLLAAFILSIAILNTVEAQEYIRVNKDFTDKNIKFFKGEIYPVSGKDGNKKKFWAGDTECEAVSDVTIINETQQDKTAEKDLFIKIKENGQLHVDVSSVATGQDTIWVVNTAGEKRVPLLNNTETDLNPNNVNITGSFRLIIPNTVTIWYNKNELTTYAEPQPATATTETIDSQAKEENPGNTLIIILVIVIVVLLLIIAAIFGYLFYRKRKRSQAKIPITTEYNKKKSLSDFAEDNGIDLMRLLRLNKDTINQSYHEYHVEDQRKIESELSGSELIVGYEDIKKQASGDNFRNENNGLSGELLQLQNNIVREIRQMNSANKNPGEINTLNNKITLLKEENDRLKQNLARVAELENNKLSLTERIQSAGVQNKNLQSQIEDFRKRVIIVDYLKGYADSVYSYLKFCQQVSAEAYQAYNRIRQSDQAFGAGLLLMNFQTSVNQVPIGSWMQIVQDIKETGATTNKNLIRSFSQIQNENEKLKEFQRQLFKEVLVIYSSHLLILAEAFRNLTRFQVSQERAFDIQDTFGKYVLEIVNKARTVEMEIKYVPLFKHFEEYLGQTESTDRSRSSAYKEIKGLQKNDIAEVVSYGVKTIFEDSRTRIILA